MLKKWSNEFVQTWCPTISNLIPIPKLNFLPCFNTCFILNLNALQNQNLIVKKTRFKSGVQVHMPNRGYYIKKQGVGYHLYTAVRNYDIGCTMCLYMQGTPLATKIGVRNIYFFNFFLLFLFILQKIFWIFIHYRESYKLLLNKNALLLPMKS